MLKNRGRGLVGHLHHFVVTFSVEVKAVIFHLLAAVTVRATVGAVRQDVAADVIVEAEELLPVGDDCVFQVERQEALCAEEAPLVDVVGARVQGELLHGNRSGRICDRILTHEAFFRHFGFLTFNSLLPVSSKLQVPN